MTSPGPHERTSSTEQSSVPVDGAPAGTTPAGDARDSGYDPDPGGATRGSAGVDGQQRRRAAPLGWLPWAAIAGLLVVVAAIVLAASFGLRDERDLALVGPTDASVTEGDQDPGTEGSDPEVIPDGPEAVGGVESVDGTDDIGSLQVGETALFGADGVQDLAPLRDQQAVGRGVLVESVVADEGFWVGNGPQNRVFVLLTPQARQSADESGIQVEPGQRVDIDGTVEALQDRTPADFGVEATEAAAELTAQGAFLSVDQIRISAP